MLISKGCPKCKGDVILGNKDEHGWYDECLQCGYIHDLKDLKVIAPVEKQPPEMKRKTMPSRPRRQAS
jgi:hypothetical protein